jgi:site-specific DNA-methyltransferase (adenine-specific)
VSPLLGEGGELRHGDWESVLADVAEVDAVIVDPPYSARVHSGHDTGAKFANKKTKHLKGNGVHDTTRPRRSLAYNAWGQNEIDSFVDSWAPRNRGWFAAFSDSDLCLLWRQAFERHGLTGFAPVPILIPGRTVRMAGDGPSSWTVYVNVARPKRLCKWGTLPGGYYGTVLPADRKAQVVAGGQPLWSMRALVRDYTKPGDLVCDPCAGGATTIIAAVIEGRRAIGAEVDAATFEVASRRLAGLGPITPRQPSLAL